MLLLNPKLDLNRSVLLSFDCWIFFKYIWNIDHGNSDERFPRWTWDAVLSCEWRRRFEARMSKAGRRSRTIYPHKDFIWEENFFNFLLYYEITFFHGSIVTILCAVVCETLIEKQFLKKQDLVNFLLTLRTTLNIQGNSICWLNVNVKQRMTTF